MEMKYKRIIFSKAKKDRKCWLCDSPWRKDDDIAIIKDLEKDSFELICFKCGEDLLEICNKQKNRKCVDDFKTYIENLPESNNKSLLLESFGEIVLLLKLCEEGGGNDKIGHNRKET